MKIQEVSGLIGVECEDLRCLDHWLLDTFLPSDWKGSGYVFTARVAVGMGKKLRDLATWQVHHGYAAPCA